MNGIEVNHCCKEYVLTFFLRKKSYDVIFHRYVLSPPTSMNSALLPSVGNKDRGMQVDSEISQVRLDNCVGEREFGRPFGKQVEARH
jgi:hypothetical protein